MKKFIASILSLSIFTANAFTITGAGASFPYPIYAKWAESYKAETGNIVNYQSIGSSGGIKQINAKTVDFGASDVAVKEEELNKYGQIQFPMVTGGVVLVVNLKGVKNNQINLSIDQVADIFSGRITNWKELDQGLEDLPITLAVRSDGSGTTGVFTQYLSDYSKSFKQDVGVGKQVNWPSNRIGGKGNAGVAATVKQVVGTIGYVEYAYAKQNNLITTRVNSVIPSAENFANDQWIFTAETYIITYQNSSSKKLLADFVKYCYSQDNMVLDLDYVPISNAKKQAALKLLNQE